MKSCSSHRSIFGRSRCLFYSSHCSYNNTFWRLPLPSTPIYGLPKVTPYSSGNLLYNKMIFLNVGRCSLFPEFVTRKSRKCCLKNKVFIIPSLKRLSRRTRVNLENWAYHWKFSSLNPELPLKIKLTLYLFHYLNVLFSINGQLQCVHRENSTTKRRGYIYFSSVTLHRKLS